MTPSLHLPWRGPSWLAGRRLLAARTVACLSALLLAAGVCGGQHVPVEGSHYASEPHWGAGAIGQPLVAAPTVGYFQPVQISAPPGVLIAPAAENAFDMPQPVPLMAGLLVGQSYRFAVTGIPRNEGLEVFPTIQVIDRLYPPVEQSWRFPIPIELTLEELEMALSGKMVTRVVYVEDPRTPLPFPQDPSRQPYLEVLSSEDPLEVAEQLGRPVAILRMGSRFPGPEGPSEMFLYGSPPLQRYIEPMVPPPAVLESAAVHQDALRGNWSVVPGALTIPRSSSMSNQQ